MDPSVAGMESGAAHRPKGWRRSSLVFCCLSLAVWAVSVIFLWPVHGLLLNWDEVDYVNAAKLGAWANVVEMGSLSPSHFISFALAKLSGSDPTLPAGYDESQDPLLLRHYHPPFVVLLLSGVSASKDERVIRSVQLLGALAFSCVIVFSYRSISDSAEWSGMLLVSLLTLWMSQMLFGWVSFHGWEAVWVTASAALMGQWLSFGKRAMGVFLCASLALALLTLQTGMFVWAGAILCMAIWRTAPSQGGGTGFAWQHLAVGAVLVALFVVAVWPGSLTKASLPKIFALYFYLIWLGDEYAAVPSFFMEHARLLLPMLVLGSLACFWLIFVNRAQIRRWGPSVVVGSIYAIGIVRFALRPEYLLPALAPFICIVGAAADHMFSRAWYRIPLVAVALAVIVITWPQRSTTVSNGELREDLNWLEDALRGREALVDGGHIYEYYMGPGYAIRPIAVSYRGDNLSLRERGRYQTLGHYDVEGKMVVVQKSRQSFFGSPAEKTLLGSCLRIRRLTIMVYDCATGQASPG